MNGPAAGHGLLVGWAPTPEKARTSTTSKAKYSRQGGRRVGG
jgi:hypothetical protein